MKGSSVVTKKPSGVPRRKSNPTEQKSLIPEPLTAEDEVAMRRLKQIEKRSRSVQVDRNNRTRRQSKGNDDIGDPIAEMKLQRKLHKRKSRSIAKTASKASVSSDDPLAKLKGERDAVKAMKSQSLGSEYPSADEDHPIATLKDELQTVKRIQSRDPQVHSLASNAFRTNGAAEHSDNPMAELKRERDAVIRSKLSLQQSEGSSVSMTAHGRKESKVPLPYAAVGSSDDPMSELKKERDAMKRSKSRSTNPDSPPLKTSRRKESKAPQRTQISCEDDDSDAVLEEITQEREKKQRASSELSSGEETGLPSRNLQESVLMDLQFDNHDKRFPIQSFDRKESKAPTDFNGGSSSFAVKAFGREDSTVLSNPVHGKDNDANNRTGTSLPVKSLSRKASKRPPSTKTQEVELRHGSSLPIKSLERKASKVPPNTNSYGLTAHKGGSLPMRSFGRKESKVPPNAKSRNDHNGEALPAKSFGRRHSTVLPKKKASAGATAAVKEHTGCSLPIKTFSRTESKKPKSFTSPPTRSDRHSLTPNTIEDLRHGFAVMPMFSKKSMDESSEGRRSDEENNRNGWMKRMKSMQPGKFNPFRRRRSIA